MQKIEKITIEISFVGYVTNRGDNGKSREITII